MRKELTDAMIAESLTNTSNFSMIVGIAFIILAVVLLILMKKKSDPIKASAKKTIKLVAVMFMAGALLIFKGVTSGGENTTEFAVAECKITDKYTKKTRNSNNRKYWIECADTYKIKISRNKYYDDYEIGDTIYVIVKKDDVKDSIHYYNAEEYEYVGSKLLE